MSILNRALTGISVALFFLSTAHADLTSCKNAHRDSVKACNQSAADGKTAGSVISNQAWGSCVDTGQSTSECANLLGLVGAKNEDILTKVIGDCEDGHIKCQGACRPDGKNDAQIKAEADACAKDIKTVQIQAKAALPGAVAAKTQSPLTAAAAKASGGGLNMSTLGAGLAGAAAGFLVAKALAPKGNTQSTAANPVATGSLQLNGSLNCTLADSYTYADCDGYLASACASAGSSQVPGAPPVTGTVIANSSGMATTPNCAAFAARYCSTTLTPSRSAGNVLSNGAVTQVNLAGTGEGMGTPFCKNSVANAYCSDPTNGAARARCPSCLTQASNQSAACIANPALCLAQISPTQITQARTTCPDDPVFSDPTSQYANGSAVATGTPVLATSSMKGPTSDVQGKHANLFATSSQVIHQRCLAGMLNNCP